LLYYLPETLLIYIFECR